MKQEYRDALTIYQQIAYYIETAILEGVLASGERLSSLRDNAVELEVNVNTIMRAYNVLEEVGVLTKKRRLGFFISNDAVDIILKKRREIFFEHTVPELLESMARLGIDKEELFMALKKTE